MRFVFAGEFGCIYFACVLMLDVYHVATGAESDIRGNGVSQSHTLKKRKDLDPQTCVDNFDIHRDKIIRTEDSREMGAKYLSELDLASREECLRLCCETDECDVFVYEEKEPGSCYLFRCGPPEDFKCKFTRHTNFTSAVLAISRPLAELEDQIRLTKHEQDLASLRKRVREREEEMMARGTLENTLTAKTSTTTTTAVVPTPGLAYRKETTVSPPAGRRCSRYQFECHSSGECIAIYNACDGVPQCSDSSDEAAELGCPAASTEQPPAPPPAHSRRPVQLSAPPAPPKELMPPPQTYDSSDEPIIQKGPPANHPPFMRPISQEPNQWPNRLSQIQSSVQNLQMKPYEDERRSHIFNHKGGLQVTEAESAAPSIYDYKGPYETLPDSSWQRRQWPQLNPDQMTGNDGRPLYHMEQEPINSWKPQSPSSLESDQRQMESMMPRMRPIPQQSMEKYEDRSSDNYMVNKNKMWPIPQSPVKTPIPQRYPDVMSNSPHSHSTQTDHGSHEEYIQNVRKPPGTLAAEDTPWTNSDKEEDESESSTQTKQKPIGKKMKEETQNKQDKPQEQKTRKHKKKEGYEVEAEDEVIKETSIVVNRKKIVDDEDDHDGLSTSPPGAIIILIIGLIMTGTMMVMICWRAKLSRRRRRGTKGGFAHDADYLVNGMYL